VVLPLSMCAYPTVRLASVPGPIEHLGGITYRNTNIPDLRQPLYLCGGHAGCSDFGRHIRGSKILGCLEPIRSISLAQDSTKEPP